MKPALMLTLTLTLMAAAAQAAAPAVRLVMPTAAQSAAAGRPFEPLVVRWWQWMSNADNAQALDETGRHCRLGQGRDIWFLAGTVYAKPVRRSCYMPHGTPVFFPLITMLNWPEPGETNLSCERAMLRSLTPNDSAHGLFVELNGRRAAGLLAQRATSGGCFDASAHFPKGDKRRRMYPSAADGYWALLDPLPRGIHVLKFGGRFFMPGQPFGDAFQDVEYRIHVY